MLKNTVTVIAGAAGLIGRRLAEAVVENGGKVVVADISFEKAEETADRLGREAAFPAVLDITSKSSINSLIDQFHKKFVKIDAFVNSAYPKSKNFGRSFFDVEYEDFCDMMRINMGGYFLAAQQFALYFKNNNGGNIVNMSSIYGVIAPKFDIYDNTPITMMPEYAVIKSGLIHLTKFMAAYLKGDNVRVNCISPGGVRDAQSDIFQRQYKEKCLNKGMIDPEDLKGTLVYLLSDMSRYVNGQNIIVDDGFCL